MRLRTASISDIPILILIAQGFIKEAPNYQSRELDIKALEENLRTIIDGVGAVFVAEKGEQIVGGIVCITTKDWFNNQVIAFEQVFYVLPEYRATRAPLMLIDAFISWARHMGASRVQSGTTTGISTKGCVRLYEHFGFIQHGILLDLELGNE